MSKLKFIDFGISTQIGQPQIGMNLFEVPYEFLLFENNLARPEFDAFGYAMLICAIEYPDIFDLN